MARVQRHHVVIRSIGAQKTSSADVVDRFQSPPIRVELGLLPQVLRPQPDMGQASDLDTSHIVGWSALPRTSEVAMPEHARRLALLVLRRRRHECGQGNQPTPHATSPRRAFGCSVHERGRSFLTRLLQVGNRRAPSWSV